MRLRLLTLGKRMLTRSFLPLALLTASTLQAQSSLTESQRREYGRQFQAPSIETPKANPEEIRILLDAQEKRLSVPLNTTNYTLFLKKQFNVNAFTEGTIPPVLKYLIDWNHTALMATSLDHYNPNAKPKAPPKSYAEQLGPARSSRALAIMHLAVFEAVNTITKRYQSYQDVQGTIVRNVNLPAGDINPASASINRAIVEAAFETLSALYPHKKELFKTARLVHLPQLQGSIATDLGARVGVEAARAVLALRKLDGSELPDLSSDDFESSNPALWHQDPISKLKPALGGNWPRVTPFVVDGDAIANVFTPGSPSPVGFCPPRPPAFGTKDFIDAYKDVKKYGGDPNAPNTGERHKTDTVRTGADNPSKPNPADNSNQTFVGIFWAYDGTALLCAPPRLYNMIATSVALREKPIAAVDEMACYLAFVNICMADAAIAAWHAKYRYLYPRPITAIRSVDADSSSEGQRDEKWTPLGAPVTNGTRENRNLTPPFPAYPSGHATFGGALFRAMSLFLKTPVEGIPFKFVSDEYNGFNRSPGDATPRDRVVASFGSFQDAEKMNARSRIYLGIHWQFDADRGVEQGNRVAEDIFPRFVKELPH